MNSEKYYDADGSYLEDHQDFLNQANQKRDAGYLIDALELKKTDRILDLQCAQGRLSIELAKSGFDVVGVDFSEYMLELAKEFTAEQKLEIKYIKQDINNLDLGQLFDKVFIFFPDWSGIDLSRLLQSVGRVMKKGGWFFYDHDNLFRLLNFLEQNKTESWFDADRMLFLDKNDQVTQGDRYFVMTELESIFEQNGFKIIKKMGGWELGEKYDWSSPRLRVVGEKE